MAGVDPLGNSLGQIDFLNLLSTQLQNQDPMNPVSDTEFVSQLAQFSALQASNDTKTAVTSMSSQETKIYAASMLNQTVSGTNASTQQSFSGLVTGVDISSDSPKIFVNGSPVALTDIQRISK